MTRGAAFAGFVWIAFFACSQAIAASVPPPPDAPADQEAQHIQRIPVTTLIFGRMKIRLEDTKFADVINRFHTGPRGRRGDASEGLDWFCFTLANGDRVWLESDEMGGGVYIDGVAAERARASADENCPLASNKAALDHGVWLGMTRKQLIQLLGQPYEQGPIAEFNYQAIIPAHAGSQELSIWSGLAVEFEHGRVIRLWANKTTMN